METALQDRDELEHSKAHDQSTPLDLGPSGLDLEGLSELDQAELSNLDGAWLAYTNETPDAAPGPDDAIQKARAAVAAAGSPEAVTELTDLDEPLPPLSGAGVEAANRPWYEFLELNQRGKELLLEAIGLAQAAKPNLIEAAGLTDYLAAALATGETIPTPSVAPEDITLADVESRKAEGDALINKAQRLKAEIDAGTAKTKEEAAARDNERRKANQ